jgi:hypothetical protein
MKLAAAILLLTVFGASSYADSQYPEVSLYDKLLKLTYSPGQPLTLALDGKEYAFGPFNEKPLIEAIANDPEAQKLFQKSAEEQRILTYNLLGSLGLIVAGAGVEYYSGTLPKNSSAASTWGWTGVGLLLGGLILDFANSSHAASASDTFYKGINQYNRDVLSNQP